MSRHAIPWNVRAVERAMEEQTLIAQARREANAVDRLIAAANADIARAERRIAAAARIEVNQHATLAKAEREAFLLAGLLERDGAQKPVAVSA